MAALFIVEPRKIWVATSSIWAGTIFVLRKGSMAYESDTQKFKWGDGINVYRDLPYAASGGDMSQPPPGNYCVTNLYVDAQTGKLAVEYEIPGG